MMVSSSALLQALALTFHTLPLAWTAAPLSPSPVAILFELHTDEPALRRAVHEARRFLYELSGELAELVPISAHRGGLAAALARRQHGVLVAPEGRLASLHPALTGPPLPAAAGAHFTQLLQTSSSDVPRSEALRAPLLVCSGGDGVTTLYSVYSAMEALGVRFRNHGDVIPRDLRGTGRLTSLLAGLRLPADRVWRQPNMALRGSQPFFDFPAGPDWWGVEEYKHFFEQMAKHKMNFMGLHTYKNEPTVWQDSNTSMGNFDAASGNVTRVPTFPQFQYTYTTTQGGWGQNATGAGWTGTSGTTSSYLFGGAQMYHEDCYTTSALMGDLEICPNPVSEAAQASHHCARSDLCSRLNSTRNILTIVTQARIFNNVAAMLKEVFSYARFHLGFKTAVGTEAPRNAFFIDSMEGGVAAAQSTYEAVFQRIEKAYPIDYWWTWTPEGFIWNEGSPSAVGAMAAAPVLASSCPASPAAGTGLNTWTLNATTLQLPSAADWSNGSEQTVYLLSLVSDPSGGTQASTASLTAGAWCLRPCAAAAIPSLDTNTVDPTRLSHGDLAATLAATCKAGDVPVLAPCNASAAGLGWIRDGALLRVAASPGLCMESASCTHDPAGGTWWCQGPTISLEKCKTGYTGQLWDFLPTRTADTPDTLPVMERVPPKLGTQQVMEDCDDSAFPASKWTATTIATGVWHGSPITRIAFTAPGDDDSGISDPADPAAPAFCLSCAGVDVNCHLWGCARIPRSSTAMAASAAIDRNCVFSLAATSDPGRYTIRSFTNTTLVPVGPGQAEPGFCVTATVRDSGSGIMLAKCDPALQEKQVFQLSVGRESTIELPGDDRAQPPLKALCVDLGTAAPGPPSPSPPSPKPIPGVYGTFKVRGPVHWGNNGCLSAAPTPSCNAYWGIPGYRQKECALIDFNAMLAAHKKLKPSFGLAVSGWTMGPGPESFPPGNASWLNKQLPPDVAISAINVECGMAPPDPGLQGLTDHSTWSIPWMEDDGGQ